MLNGGTIGWEHLEQWGFLPVLLVLAWLGSVCLLRPFVIVGFLQRQYSHSGLFRATLFSNWVFKPWYSTWIRFWGFIVWVFVLVALFGLLTSSGS